MITIKRADRRDAVGKLRLSRARAVPRHRIELFGEANYAKYAAAWQDGKRSGGDYYTIALLPDRTAAVGAVHSRFLRR